MLREERIRIIKSASRRNPKLLARAIVRSKAALQEHAEWRIHQEIMRSCSSSLGKNSPGRHRATNSNVSIDVSMRGQQLPSPAGESTQVRTSTQPHQDRGQNRSAAASVHSSSKQPNTDLEKQTHQTVNSSQERRSEQRRRSRQRSSTHLSMTPSGQQPGEEPAPAGGNETPKKPSFDLAPDSDQGAEPVQSTVSPGRTYFSGAPAQQLDFQQNFAQMSHGPQNINVNPL